MTHLSDFQAVQQIWDTQLSAGNSDAAPPKLTLLLRCLWQHLRRDWLHIAPSVFQDHNDLQLQADAVPSK